MSGDDEGIEMSSSPYNHTHIPENQNLLDETHAQQQSDREVDDLGVREEGNMVGGGFGSSARRRSIAHSFGEDDRISGQERRIAAREFWRRMFINGSLIALWYVFWHFCCWSNAWLGICSRYQLQWLVYPIEVRRG
jgi:hypothetical protein